MLYGQNKADRHVSTSCASYYSTVPLCSQINLDPLSCVEFLELLQLVTVCRVETLDAQLTSLQKHSRKWYFNLIL